MKKKNIRKLWRTRPNVNSVLVDSGLPALEAEILLSHVLKIPRTKIFAHPETKLSSANEQSFNDLVESRRQGIPLAYLTGEKEFYGLRLKVDRRALIPRPETEELVLEALKMSPKVVADIGTGSGAIALSLATHLPYSKIYATDISDEALDLARENADLLKLSHRITFLQGHLAEPLPEKVDLIVANLPYIMTPWLKNLPKDILEFEPLIALDGGDDGLRWYRELFATAEAKLLPEGRILYELDGRVLVWEPKARPLKSR